ncbi:MAG: aminoacetone oxidase family FAD-binding enzyme [Lachnospiraceae bacterium]|nr:aminoacetone oxidase family FAD-binding enzyme [Lachnospiraceae bacterium]
MIFDLMVIGGGASGLAAAVTAGRLGASVLVLERMKEPGRKILASGNGRCNLTNQNISSDIDKEARLFAAYRSDSDFSSASDEGFIRHVISRFDSKKAEEFFASTGVLTHSRGEYVYPRSDQAKTVRDALVRACEETGSVRIITGCRVLDIACASEGFTAACEDGKAFTARKLILAAGGRSQEKLGSDGSGERIAASFGHHIIPSVPALCSLKTDDPGFFRAAAGVRSEGRVALYIDGEMASEEIGEIQYTSTGLSGIPVFQVSRYAGKALSSGSGVLARLDLLPDMGSEALFIYLSGQSKAHPDYAVLDLLSGILNEKLSFAVLEKTDIAAEKAACKLSKRELHKICNALKESSFNITGTAGFEDSQVTSGGVSLNEVDPDTMMSKLVPGLYITGELLDFDGICGGYNLHMAWATGIIAGRSASES